MGIKNLVLQGDMRTAHQGRQQIDHIGHQIVEDHEEVADKAHVVHGALHGAQLEGVEKGDKLAPNCAVVLEQEVRQLDNQQNGKRGNLRTLTLMF
jgi:hypothetical protein